MLTPGCQLAGNSLSEAAPCAYHDRKVFVHIDLCSAMQEQLRLATFLEAHPLPWSGDGELGWRLARTRHGHALEIALDFLERMTFCFGYLDDHKDQRRHAEDRVHQECVGAAERGDQIEEGRRDDQVEAPVRDGRQAHRPAAQ